MKSADHSVASLVAQGRNIQAVGLQGIAIYLHGFLGVRLLPVGVGENVAGHVFFLQSVSHCHRQVVVTAACLGAKPALMRAQVLGLQHGNSVRGEASDAGTGLARICPLRGQA